MSQRNGLATGLRGGCMRRLQYGERHLCRSGKISIGNNSFAKGCRKRRGISRCSDPKISLRWRVHSKIGQLLTASVCKICRRRQVS
ncbi:hypothetical protein Y032_0050g1990 [Ancylostoma ceylanicum]|nr:hypothetical protein Y032_0050g1990 [Ancylostoma ceylanicum]